MYIYIFKSVSTLFCSTTFCSSNFFCDITKHRGAEQPCIWIQRHTQTHIYMCVKTHKYNRAQRFRVPSTDIYLSNWNYHRKPGSRNLVCSRGAQSCFSVLETWNFPFSVVLLGAFCGMSHKANLSVRTRRDNSLWPYPFPNLPSPKHPLLIPGHLYGKLTVLLHPVSNKKTTRKVKFRWSGSISCPQLIHMMLECVVMSTEKKK